MVNYAYERLTIQTKSKRDAEVGEAMEKVDGPSIGIAGVSWEEKSY